MRAITVVELTSFQRRAEKILSAEEYKDVIDFLAMNPMAGDEIQGTGGVRKVRFAMGNKGKSGGARVIYYFYSDTIPALRPADLWQGGADGPVGRSAPNRVKAGRCAARHCEGAAPMTRSNFADDLTEALNEAIRHARGEDTGAALHEISVEMVDVRAIRTGLGLSRPKFAERFGLDARTVQDWEQGRRRPDKAAQSYLKVIAHNPDVVAGALLR